jgi:branched-subunit amino acid transport protein
MLSHRLIATAVALVVYFASRRNLLLGTVAGVGAFAGLAQWGTLP